MPEYTSKIVNEGIQKYDTDYIFKTGLQMLGVSLISIISAILIMLLSSRVGAKLAANLREKIYKNILCPFITLLIISFILFVISK